MNTTPKFMEMFLTRVNTCINIVIYKLLAINIIETNQKLGQTLIIPFHNCIIIVYLSDKSTITNKTKTKLFGKSRAQRKGHHSRRKVESKGWLGSNLFFQKYSQIY